MITISLRAIGMVAETDSYSSQMFSMEDGLHASSIVPFFREYRDSRLDLQQRNP